MLEQQGRWLAGEIRDDYELRTTISLGTLAGARVMRGVARKSGQWHAIKFISHEKLLMTRVRHPNVVKLLAYYEPTKAKPEAALVMPEADFTLHEYIYRSFGRTWLSSSAESVRVDIAAQLSEGLAFIHQNKVVHRDLHPANVLMALEPSSPCRIAGCGARSHSSMRVLVADFSRACEVGATCEDLPTAYGNCGPERLCRDSLQYSPAFDVWSLGTICFELAVAEPLVIRPTTSYGAKKDVSRKWAVECLQVRTGRQQGHGALCHDQRTAESTAVSRVQAWQDSYRSSEARQCSECGAVLLAALHAAPHWHSEDRASAADIMAILKGPSVAPSLTPPTLASHSGQTVASNHLDTEPETVILSPRSDEAAVSSHVGATHDAVVDAVWANFQTSIDSITSAASRREAPKPDVPFFLRQQPPALKQTTSLHNLCKCQCSGHCYNPGHSRHGCKRRDLALDTAFCVECCCTVSRCTRPKCSPTMCSMHLRVHAAMSWEWQITRATKGFIDALIPCDLDAFLAWFSECHEDLVKVIMLALIKEPSPIEAWAATNALDRPFGGPLSGLRSFTHR